MDSPVQHPVETTDDSRSPGETSTFSDNELRAKARALVQKGVLPAILPKQRLGGPGNGAPCNVCCVAVQPDEIDIEIELAPGHGGGAAGNLHFHVRCISALEREVRTLQDV